MPRPLEDLLRGRGFPVMRVVKTTATREGMLVTYVGRDDEHHRVLVVRDTVPKRILTWPVD